jgi:L-asparaginase
MQHAMQPFTPCGVSLLRQGVVEAIHPMHWFTSHRQSHEHAGNDAPVYARSSLKPIQMAVLRQALQTYDPERLASIPPEAWAVGMASHSGETHHQHWVHWWLHASGLGLKELQCGSHPAIAGQHPASVACHNCSGKHAAIVACCTWLGWPVETYTHPTHPYQQRLIEYLHTLWNHPVPFALASPLHWGVDGCTLPTPALPLAQWRPLFHSFMQRPEGQECLTMMQRFPALISGLDAVVNPRFDMVLMQAAPHLVSKVGAMGFLVVWYSQKSDVLVLKCESGSTEYRDAYAWWLLAKLGWMDEAVARPYILEQTQSPYAIVQNSLLYS